MVKRLLRDAKAPVSDYDQDKSGVIRDKVLGRLETIGFLYQ